MFDSIFDVIGLLYIIIVYINYKCLIQDLGYIMILHIQINS
jgi:hypothetical protein